MIDGKRTPPNDATGVACDVCKVAPGTWCRTAEGHVAKELHAPRVTRWRESFPDDDDRYVVVSSDDPGPAE